MALLPLASLTRGDAGDADLVGDAGGDCKLPREEEESLPPMPPPLLLLLLLLWEVGSGDTAWLRSSLLGLLASGGELSPSGDTSPWSRAYDDRYGEDEGGMGAMLDGRVGDEASFGSGVRL